MRLQRQSRSNVLHRIAEQIELENNRKPSSIIHLSFNPYMCKCLICENVLNQLTHAHAGKHGYPSKEAMIADGKVQFFEQEAKRKCHRQGGL